jgi:uncharacterized membrane protein YedE/YeeE
MGILLAFMTGAGLGYVIERGDFCFHSTLRGLVSVPRQLDLFRAYLLALLVAVPLVNGLIAVGWIEPWIPPFAWQANISGGLIFGVGMVVAATCITGLFYKLGHGMLGTLVGLATWAIGDIITYRGPLSPVRDGLNASPLTVSGQSATTVNLFDPIGIALIAILGVAVVLYLRRSPQQQRGKLWGWLPLGLAVGLVTSLAWLLAKAGDANYTFGTSGVPAGIYGALTEGGAGGSLWIPVTLASLVPGAFIAARRADTLWIRGETIRRYGELAIGGFLMGVGAGIAGGCNLGHSLVGVPLLSLGSITTTLSMAVGVFLADRALKIWRGGRER